MSKETSENLWTQKESFKATSEKLWTQKESCKATSDKTDLEKVFSSISLSEIKNVSVYTNEFDLSMIRVFFPKLICKIGYIKDSCSLSSSLSKEVSINHKMSVTRSSSVLEFPVDEGDVISCESFYIYTLRGDPEVLNTEKEETKIIECSYISSLFPEVPAEVSIGDRSFSEIAGGKLQITNVGLYSLTTPVYSKKLCDIIKRGRIPKCVFDGTACVGGDTIGFFTCLGCNVVSIEKDPVNFEALKNNISLYDHRSKIKIFNGDFLIDGYPLIEKEKPDLVYFDPPWGGRDYNIQKNLELYLGDKNIKDIIFRILEEYSFVCTVILKVPVNYCNFSEEVISTNNIKSNIVKMSKFNIIFIERTTESCKATSEKLRSLVTSVGTSEKLRTPESCKATSEYYTHSTLTPDYPLSQWVPVEKKKRSKSLPSDLYNMNYKSLHWGQRKLHLSEVDFFTQYTKRDEKYTVVYAGAANGQHIPLLLKLFPYLEFHLYDPAPFSEIVKNNKSLLINPHKDSNLPIGFFTDEIATKYKDTKNLLFICDIRLAPEDSSNPKYDDMFEENVNNDMKIQKDWVNIMTPKYSILKMRIPYTAKDKYLYLDGEIKLQIWAPPASTETRLIVSESNKEKEYVPEIYENQCAYFNNRVRQTDISELSFISYGLNIEGSGLRSETCETTFKSSGLRSETCETTFKDLWGEYNLFINVDCYLETRVFYNYLSSIGETPTISLLKNLIDETSSWLYEKVYPKNAFSKKVEINNRKHNTTKN